MGRSRHTEAQIAAALKQVEVGRAAFDINDPLARPAKMVGGVLGGYL